MTNNMRPLRGWEDGNLGTGGDRPWAVQRTPFCSAVDKRVHVSFVGSTKGEFPSNGCFFLREVEEGTGGE